MLPRGYDNRNFCIHIGTHNPYPWGAHTAVVSLATARQISAAVAMVNIAVASWKTSMCAWRVICRAGWLSCGAGLGLCSCGSGGLRMS